MHALKYIAIICMMYNKRLREIKERVPKNQQQHQLNFTMVDLKAEFSKKKKTKTEN